MCCMQIVNNLKFYCSSCSERLNSMKQTKFEERVENARNAFFEDEPFDVNDFLSRTNQNEFLQSAESEEIAPKISTLETIAKQVLLFFPGTFVLYILSLGFTVAFIGSFIRPTGMTLRFDLIWILLTFSAATLMTWLGLGDVRKAKHFVIPASIISVGVVVGVIVAALITIPFYGRLFFRDSFPMYVFPLALVVPFLAKGWIDRKNEN